jgi:hypothetical protein
MPGAAMLMQGAVLVNFLKSLHKNKETAAPSDLFEVSGA